MKNRKKRDEFCHCLPYGKIQEKKLERLHKNRQRQLCTWRDIVPFGERHEEILTAKSQFSSFTSKPSVFPPIYELPCITNYDTYRALYDTGYRDIPVDCGNKEISQLQHYGRETSTMELNDELNKGKDGFTYDDCNGSRNVAEPQSLKLKLPHLKSSNVVSCSRWRFTTQDCGSKEIILK